MAVFDAVVNNADRKGGHVLTDDEGRMWGIDHGVTFSVDEKLRTVLWGWAGRAAAATPHARTWSACTGLLGDSLRPGRPLARRRTSAMSCARRVRALLAVGRFPLPPARWPAVPWPVF